MPFFLAVALSIVIAMAAAVLFDWIWPQASIRRLTILAGAMAPLATIILLALFIAAMIRSGNQPSPSPDAEGMVIAAVIVLAPIILGLSLLFGLPAAHFTLRYLRGPS